MSGSRAYQQADETLPGWFSWTRTARKRYRWWLWVFLGSDALVYVLDQRAAVTTYPRGIFGVGNVSVVLMVDRLSSYKATTQVKEGLVVLAFC